MAIVGREKLVTVLRTTVFGMLISASEAVRILVDKSPTRITAPSTPPTTTHSRHVRPVR